MLIGPDGLTPFDLEHAENLLKLEAKHGFTNYTLPDDSPYEFTDDTLRRRSTGPTNKPEKSSSKGGSASVAE